MARVEKPSPWWEEEEGRYSLDALRDVTDVAGEEGAEAESGVGTSEDVSLPVIR